LVYFRHKKTNDVNLHLEEAAFWVASSYWEAILVVGVVVSQVVVLEKKKKI